MVCTRPDISNVAGILGTHTSTPKKEHTSTSKRVFMYLRGMRDYAISYGGEPEDNKENNVHGFVNSDLVGYMDHTRLTNGYVFNMSNEAISYISMR